MRRNLLVLLTSLGLSLHATEVITQTNVDADITFSLSGNSLQENFIGGQKKIVDLTWASESETITLSVDSRDPLYADTTYDTKFSKTAKEYPAWQAQSYQGGAIVTHNGKTWEAKWYAAESNEPGNGDPWKEIDPGFDNTLTIELQKRDLPNDTAFIPVTVNTPITLKATALSLLDGSTPSPVTFRLESDRKYTIALPVYGGGTATATHAEKSATTVTLSKTAGAYQLSLPQNYHNGVVKIFSLNGQQLGYADLTSAIANRLSIWDVASGIYILQAQMPTGEQFVSKLQHEGGILSIASSFAKSQSVSFFTSRNATRASTAEYRFEVTSDKQNYSDSTFTVHLTGKENSALNLKLPTQPANLEDFLTKATYEAIFPHRYGVGTNNPSEDDFYTYESLKEAIQRLAKYKATVYTKKFAGGDRVVVEYDDGTTNTYYSISGYDSNSNPETSTYVDYSTLLNWGEADSVKYELVAILAHMGSETTGRPVGQPDQWEYGLYWVHEMNWGPDAVGGYVDANHSTYPAVAGQSYHGRGPKQLSYNYNYGQFSDFLYGDKNVLLNDPNIVSTDPVVSFMSALWFWMTPQGEKPSCHMVMSGEWQPSAEDSTKGRHLSRFGMTTNVINGGVECGSNFSELNNEKRLGHYNFFADLMQVVPEDELSCKDIQSY